MKTRTPHLVLAAALLVGACAQTSTLPSPDSKAAAEISDLGRDLGRVSRSEKDAAQEFAEDLGHFLDVELSESPAGPAALGAVTQLAMAVQGALDGKSLNEEQAGALGTLLWTAVARRDLNDAQLQTLRTGLGQALATTGVSQDTANAVLSMTDALQGQIRVKQPRRWFESPL